MKRMRNDPWDFDDESAARRYRAAMSNGRGRQFESMIEGACRGYKAHGKAKIEKMPEPFRCMKKNIQQHTATVRFTAHAEPDYIGCLIGGKSIVFEAKYTDTSRMHQDAVTKAQAASLDKYMALGAQTNVCIGIQDEYFMIPWRVFSNMKKLYGRKYVTAADVMAYRVKFDGTVRFLEYAYPSAAHTDYMEQMKGEKIY